MTYVDTSVVLAYVFGEGRRPPPEFWTRDRLVSSRLTEFEGWVRTQAYGRADTHGSALAGAIAALDLVAIDDAACARCRAPFPVPVRTLDAIHLATIDFLRTRGLAVRLATYDERMRQAASAMNIPLVELP